MVLSEKKKTTGETPVVHRSSKKPGVASAEKKNDKAALKKKDEPRTETKKNEESSPMSKKEKRELQKIRQKEKDLARITEANRKMMETPDLNAHRSVTSPPDRKRARQEQEEEPAITVGAFVKVSADYSPGVNREEGYGYIDEVNLSSVEAAALPTATVKYVVCGTRHRRIPLAALTISDLGAAFAQKRRRTSSRVSTSVSKQAQGTGRICVSVTLVTVNMTRISWSYRSIRYKGKQ